MSAAKFGLDPYRLFNGLDENYERLDEPVRAPARHAAWGEASRGGRQSHRPPNPARVRAFTYGAAMAVYDIEKQVAGIAESERGVQFE